jgi:hypothetical protein
MLCNAGTEKSTSYKRSSLQVCERKFLTNTVVGNKVICLLECSYCAAYRVTSHEIVLNPCLCKSRIAQACSFSCVKPIASKPRQKQIRICLYLHCLSLSFCSCGALRVRTDLTWLSLGKSRVLFWRGRWTFGWVKSWVAPWLSRYRECAVPWSLLIRQSVISTSRNSFRYRARLLVSQINSIIFNYYLLTCWVNNKVLVRTARPTNTNDNEQ